MTSVPNETGNKFLESTEFYGLSQSFAAVVNLWVMESTGQQIVTMVRIQIQIRLLETVRLKDKTQSLLR